MAAQPDQRAPSLRARRVTGIVVACALSLALACSVDGEGAGSVRARNAILITLDTTRADALGCYGGGTFTPHLDRLAGESVLFEEARTVAPLTLPAHASMMTGLYPLRHGVRDNIWWPLTPAADVLAERARAKGFQTAAFVSSLALDKGFGLDRGFEVYDQPARPPNQADSHFAERTAPAVVRAAQDWLARRDPGRPFFLWVHFFDPHAPYGAPEGYGPAASHPYRREVAFMDAAVGNLLDGLRAEGLLDQSLLVVAGDHGESLGEHGEPTHGAFCYEGALRVPLLVRLPGGRRGGERSPALASVVDVFPTLAGALDLGRCAGLDGRDLLRLGASRDRGVYFECYAGWLSYGYSPLAGWIEGGQKYLHSTEPELYRLDLDPREQRNVFTAEVPPVGRARDAIAELARLPRLPAARDGEPVAELSKALSALGYGSAGAARAELPEPLEATGRPAPRQKTAEIRELARSIELAESGRFAEAADLLRQIVRSNPLNLEALNVLSVVLMTLQEYEEAHEVLRLRLEGGPGQAVNWINLGAVLMKLGRPQEAEQALERGLALGPGHELGAKALEFLRAQSRAGNPESPDRLR
jgi:choline-sulfatase